MNGPAIPPRRGRDAGLGVAMLLATVLTAANCTGAGSARGTPIGRWTALPAGPAIRVRHSAVWTGTHMLVWGGQQIRGARFRADGDAFDPASGRWSAVPGAPLAPRGGNVAAWTGSRLLVWGGDVQGPRSGTHSFGDGASFDPR